MACNPTSPYGLREMHARLWVFFPTYNEAGNVEDVVRATAAQLQRMGHEDWGLLVVDDASPDGTGELADGSPGARASGGPAPVGQRGPGQGLPGGIQVRGGARRRVRGRDGRRLVARPRAPSGSARRREHSDLVLGSRYVAGGQIADWPPLRRLLSRLGSLYARLILRVRVNDLTSGFRLVRRQVLETVEPSTLRSQGYVFNIELTYRALLAGFTVAEVPIRFRDRKAGESKMSLPIAFEALMLVPKLRPLRKTTVEVAVGVTARRTASPLAHPSLAAARCRRHEPEGRRRRRRPSRRLQPQRHGRSRGGHGTGKAGDGQRSASAAQGLSSATRSRRPARRPSAAVR